MQYIRLGNSGLKVSRLCLGMMSYGAKSWRDWVLGEEEADEHVRTALDHGINFFDTANVYSLGVSEEITGRTLLKHVRRDEVVIATKVRGQMRAGDVNGMGLSRKHIMEQVDASLRRLGTDYIDLYQIHRWDYDVPIEETMAALHDTVKAGKVRYIGASSMFAWQFAKAQYTADLNGWTRFVSMQNHYNLLYREEEREMNPFCVDQGVGLIPWSPLARGYLTGSRTREGSNTVRSQSDPFGERLYAGEAVFDIVDQVRAVAEARGVSMAQIALAWLLSKPGLAAPIIGSTKTRHLEDALGAVDVALTAAEIESLEAPYQTLPVLGHN